MECKKCHQHKPRIKRTRSGHVRWLDDKDKLWNGHTCPECRIVALRVRGRYVGRINQKTTKRKCRKCTRHLPASRYFQCLNCQQELPYDITA